MKRFNGKVVLITGGASGMGEAFCRLVVNEGGVAIIADMNEAAGVSLQTQLGPDHASYRHCDVSDFQQVQDMVSSIIDDYGCIDVLFNNAGIARMGTTPEFAPEDWQKVMEVDLFSVYHCCHAVIPHMQRQGGGSIVNNASISGLAGDYGMGCYNAAKAGVVNYTKSLAMDHGRDDIRVNAVCPGAVDTPLFAPLKDNAELIDKYYSAIPLKRLAQPWEIAELTAFLASDAAAYITGVAIPIDGGLMAATGQPNLIL